MWNVVWHEKRSIRESLQCAAPRSLSPNMAYKQCVFIARPSEVKLSH